MSNKIQIIIILFINLLIGNLILSATIARNESTFGGKMLLYSVFSTVAIILILFLAWYFKKKIGYLKIIVLPVLASLSVPAISFYIFFTGYGLSEFELIAPISSIPISLIIGFSSLPFSIPLGIINLVLFFFYNRRNQIICMS